MTTAVDAVFLGKEREFNRRFLQMCNHYLVEPVACTPAADWGQVENQVDVVRGRFFTPRLHFAIYEEVNAWLLGRCLEHASAHRHPELRDLTVADVFEDETPALMRIPENPRRTIVELMGTGKSIRDVAKGAGVSTATVQKAINEAA